MFDYYRYKGGTATLPTLPYKFEGVCPLTYTSKDGVWEPQVTNGGKSRGLLLGKPSVTTEALPLGCYDYLDSHEFPKKESYVLVDSIRRTKSSYKDFVKLWKEGVVVLKPMKAQRCEVQLVPGVPDQEPYREHMVSVRANVNINDVEEAYGQSMCGAPTKVTSIQGFELARPVGVYLKPKDLVGGWPNSLVRRNFDVYAVEELVLPPKRIAAEVYRQVEDYFNNHPHDGRLVSRAYAEANEGAWDVLTDLAEANRTVVYCLDLLGDILKKTIKLKRDLRRAQSMAGSARKISEYVSDLWLQYRYAVMPITYSVRDALEYRSATLRPYQTVRKGLDHELTLDLPDGWVANAPVKLRDRCYVKSLYALDHFTANLTVSLPRTAWELVPLSWIIDWVFHVGDFLTALDTPNSIKSRGGQYSRQVLSQQIRIDHDSGTGGHILLNIRMYEANPITQPSAWIGLPFDLEFNWKRMLDAASLLWIRSKEQYKNYRG